MKHGQILTMLDLKDIGKIARGESIRKLMLASAVALFMAAAATAIAFSKMNTAEYNLKKAEATLDKVTKERDAALLRIGQYDQMMKVVINGKQLHRPLRISGELVVMVAGEVK